MTELKKGPIRQDEGEKPKNFSSIADVVPSKTGEMISKIIGAMSKLTKTATGESNEK